ncbi:MAG: hypothetical protein HYS44_01215 [Candidatus Niyogibacteria bacterium]|nr:hypothetical protein [Candidatus Niyogibacteria bacterium]
MTFQGNSETKTCQNCKASFVIEPEDFEFYEKIKVPPPTFCPSCRFERRLAWINLFFLYKRPCDLCKKNVMSVYAPDAPYTVYCPKCWWSDKWDSFQYAKEYDSSRPFLEQWNELFHVVPLLGLSIDTTTLENSPYTNDAGNLKNCYFIFHANYDEDCAYGFYLLNSKSLLDSSACMQTEQLYDSMHAWKCSRCIGLRSYVIESLNSYFLKDCVNCQDCFACASMKNKKYCIKNTQLTKKEYERERARYDLGSYTAYKKAEAEAEAFWATQTPKAEFGDRNVNCRGVHIYDSRNVKDSFQVNQTEDSRYIQMIDPVKNSELYDATGWGDGLSLSYETSTAGTQASEIKFSQECGIGCMDLEYCKIVTESNHCFGCVGMKKGEYSVLNKRYPKEEYEKLVLKIKDDMNKNPYRDAKGRLYRYGEFFPIELSPHGYNETLAQNFFPLSKNDIEAQGYRWREEEKREYATTVKAEALPDHIKDAPDSVLKEVIECAACGKGFKVIPMELAFLREMNVPLPRECPQCRIREKFQLWMKNMEQHERVCSRCGKKFLSKYTEKEVASVLCGRCYNAEVG